jgi:hypothetical protein
MVSLSRERVVIRKISGLGAGVKKRIYQVGGEDDSPDRRRWPFRNDITAGLSTDRARQTIYASRESARARERVWPAKSRGTFVVCSQA